MLRTKHYLLIQYDITMTSTNSGDIECVINWQHREIMGMEPMYRAELDLREYGRVTLMKALHRMSERHA